MLRVLDGEALGIVVDAVAAEEVSAIEEVAGGPEEAIEVRFPGSCTLSAPFAERLIPVATPRWPRGL